MLALFIVATIMVFTLGESCLTSYPISISDLHAHIGSNAGKTDIYVSLFDAFRKGRFDLDLEVDPKLLAMENPWDPGLRGAAGVSYYWDHAFYQGKYYSYYGPLPVLLVSFPFYLFSGFRYVLTAFGLEIIGMALLIPAFLYLLLELFRLVQKKVYWPQFILFSFVGLIASMMIMTMTWKDGVYHEAIYHVPDIYGLLSFDFFLFSALRAYRDNRNRTLHLSFSGLFFVFIILSRPNLFLALAFVVPFFIGVLAEKGVSVKKKILQFAPMTAILLIGAVFVCYYNYARFDSIFEFGQSYQLNVADQRDLTYSKEKLLPTFFHFYCQGGAFYNKFPYISCTVQRFNFETSAMAPYISSYYGILGVPLFWLTFAGPFVFFREKRKSLFIAMTIFPFFLFAFAFTTYSKAGLCPRYLIEFYHLATIGSFLTLLKLGEIVKEKPSAKYVAAGGFVILALSAFVCLNLSFDSFDGMKEGSCFGLLLHFKEVFNSYNL